MKVIRQNVAGSTEILASAEFQAIPYTIASSSVSADAEGKKIAKAGTPYPSNDESVKGILIRDIDVTGGDQVAAIAYEATIDTAKAQAHSGVTIEGTAKAALPRITWL